MLNQLVVANVAILKIHCKVEFCSAFDLAMTRLIQHIAMVEGVKHQVRCQCVMLLLKCL